MANKKQLSELRQGTVINKKSKRQEKSLDTVIEYVCNELRKKFPNIKLHHDKQWLLKDIVASLKKTFPEVEFHDPLKESSMRPDGGILQICANDSSAKYPILITERKNQGTNDTRAEGGKPKQAKGNAIERLGKNVIGFRAALIQESIFPFVCFGDGCDFEAGSSILDRVVTIAMFGELNHEYLHNKADNRFNRGSFYFRSKEWTESEMKKICYSIAEKSIYYYYSVYGEDLFQYKKEPTY